MQLNLLTCAGTRGALGTTLQKGAPRNPTEPQRAHTPLRHFQFERELKTHPDRAWVSWLLHGMKYGVKIGYDGPRSLIKAKNLPSAYKHPHIIDAELAKECAAGRILGPLSSSPFPTLHCSGLGAVPKKNGKWRMIMHLSAPTGQSINDHISKEQYSLQYSSVEDAVKILTALGKGALMAKVDLKSAFRVVPVHSTDWDLLGISWRNAFYIDTCLPFGLRSAPFLFNQFAEALQWILAHNYGLHWLIHYLDDYFIAGPPCTHLCQEYLDCFLRVCQRLGVPVAMDKVEGPLTTLVFLGLELDSTLQHIRLPQEKLKQLQQELQLWKECKKTTKRNLLSLIGKLAFAARAVPAGRLFTRRLIALSSKVTKLHHRIRLNKEARRDITWWQEFLPGWNGTAKFITEDVDAHDLDLYTDASGKHGCGAYYKGAWFFYKWRPHQCLSETISIQWQELFAISAAAMTWGHLWSQKRICFHCDNQSITLAWQGKSSKQPRLMILLRKLFFIAARNTFTVTIRPAKIQLQPLEY